MTKEFIPYQQGLQLKELGFDEPCWAWWHIEDCDIRFCYSDQRSPIINSRETEVVGLPTYSQVFRWFRERYNLKASIMPIEYLDGTQETYQWNIFNECHSGVEQLTYEEAELDCLNKLIEIVCGII